MTCKRVTPACKRKTQPLAHHFLAWDRDPRFHICQYGCQTVLGPSGSGGPPIDAIVAAPQLLFGDDTPPIDPLTVGGKRLLAKQARERRKRGAQ
jgi:hypothetical protein